MRRQYLDLILVPIGLLILILYHFWLVLRLLRRPSATIIGINAANRRIWVETMMQDPGKTGVLAVQTLRNNIMASTLLASMAIMLSSLIAVLMTNGWGSSSTRNHASGFVYGDTGGVMLSVKFFSILSCFLLAFLFDVQSIRYYSHASILINVPTKIKSAASSDSPYLITTEYVARTLNMGSYFWSLGLRAFYFSMPLFLWVFGPIPMFASCVVMVFLLYFLDVPGGCWKERVGGGGRNGEEEEEEGMVAVGLGRQSAEI